MFPIRFSQSVTRIKLKRLSPLIQIAQVTTTSMTVRSLYGLKYADQIHFRNVLLSVSPPDYKTHTSCVPENRGTLRKEGWVRTFTWFLFSWL